MPTNGHRINFSKIVSQTPVLLAHPGNRIVFWLFHVSDQALRIGYSGTVATEGTLLSADQCAFMDDASSDEYWAYYAAGSGTVTGFIVV